MPEAPATTAPADLACASPSLTPPPRSAHPHPPDPDKAANPSSPHRSWHGSWACPTAGSPTPGTRPTSHRRATGSQQRCRPRPSSRRPSPSCCAVTTDHPRALRGPTRHPPAKSPPHPRLRGAHRARQPAPPPTTPTAATHTRPRDGTPRRAGTAPLHTSRSRSAAAHPGILATPPRRAPPDPLHLPRQTPALLRRRPRRPHRRLRRTGHRPPHPPAAVPASADLIRPAKSRVHHRRTHPHRME